MDASQRTPREIRQRQVAVNESNSSDRNERLRSTLEGDPDLPELLVFGCECGSAACADVVQLRMDEYEAIRSDSRRFAVVAGHVYREAERVVASTDRYQVVEKLEGAAEVADATDKRFPGTEGGRSEHPTPAGDDA